MRRAGATGLRGLNRADRPCAKHPTLILPPRRFLQVSAPANSRTWNFRTSLVTEGPSLRTQSSETLARIRTNDRSVPT